VAVQRKCPSCGTWNQDKAYCVNCSTPLAPEILEEIKEQEKIKRQEEILPSKFDVFIEKWENSPYLILRIIYKIIYSIIFVFMTIASFFAYIVVGANG
jgi:hypothetical protein